MKPLYCASCDAPHDVDLEPDMGECIICGGPLIEDETEREEVGGDSMTKKLVDVARERVAVVNAIEKSRVD